MGESHRFEEGTIKRKTNINLCDIRVHMFTLFTFSLRTPVVFPLLLSGETTFKTWNISVCTGGNIASTIIAHK